MSYATATATYLTCAETAKLVRTALKQKFPGVKFAIRSKTYSGGASIDIHWQDGPTTKQVEAVAEEYEGADFDSMQDLKTYHSSKLNGETVHFGADFVFCERAMSASLLEEAAVKVAKMYGIKTPAIEVDKWGHARLERYGEQVVGHWSAGDLVWIEAGNTPA